jgi:hypothetical protein
VKTLLVGLLFLACSAAKFIPAAESSTPSIPASKVFKAQKRIIELMKGEYPGVKAEVVWVPCGQKNAFYYPSLQKIVLCTEMEEHPETALLMAAHEMGHAITDQIIDMTDEGAADELAALAMVKHGYATELLVASLYWKRKTIQGHLAGDDHPSAGYRAWFFSCMASAYDNQPQHCVDLYYTTQLKWLLRLKVYV